MPQARNHFYRQVSLRSLYRATPLPLYILGSTCIYDVIESFSKKHNEILKNRNLRSLSGTTKTEMETAKRTILHSHHEKNFMEVVDEGEFRSLYFRNSVVQSRLRLAQPWRLVLRYTQYMMAASLLAKPVPSRILLIGVGAGALIHFVDHYLPESHIDAIDYSEHILKIARGFFSLPENDRIQIHCLDGMEFVNRNTESGTYDLILLDAFTESGMARNIYSADFFRKARQMLSESGLICCNLWSGNHNLFNTVKKALLKYSANTLFIPVRRRENVIALMFQTQTPWPKICPGDVTLAQFEEQFDICFSEVSAAARKHNMKLGERLQHWLSN